MSRGLVAGLRSRHPLMHHMPEIYSTDDFAQGLTAGLDEVLAPIFSTLDNLDVYLDPRLAPADFVDWLSGWMGLAVHERLPLEARRQFVAQAHRLHRKRGTKRGLIEFLELVTGGKVHLDETGATGWSTDADAPLPGQPGHAMLVKLELEENTELDLPWLDGLVNAVKPAYVIHHLEVRGASPGLPPIPSTSDLAAPASGESAGDEPLSSASDGSESDSTEPSESPP